MSKEISKSLRPEPSGKRIRSQLGGKSTSDPRSCEEKLLERRKRLGTGEGGGKRGVLKKKYSKLSGNQA